jgi:hypothetical protein
MMCQEQLVERIERLEKHNRWLKLLMVAVTGLCVLVSMGGHPLARGQAKEDRKIIDAHAFRIIDDKGKARGIWTALGQQGPSFVLLDPEKPDVERLKLNSDCITMKTETEMAAFQRVVAGDGALLALHDNDKGKGGITLQRDGLRLADNTGRVRGCLIQHEKGNRDAFLAIVDADGNPTFSSR